MPLELGDVSTERPRLICFDPTSTAETAEALQEIAHLRHQGFQPDLDKSVPGEVILYPPARNPNQGVFRILSDNGDDRVTWDRTNPAQIREAYKTFKEHIDKGYTAYATDSDGKKTHQIDVFDPSFEEILLVGSSYPG